MRHQEGRKKALRCQEYCEAEKSQRRKRYTWEQKLYFQCQLCLLKRSIETKKEGIPNNPCLEILILGSSEGDFLSSEMYRRLDNSSTGCMASGILKAGDRNVLRFLWNEREEVGKEYVGCGGWKADALSQKSQKTCTHSAQFLPPVKKQPGGAAETPRVEDRQFCTTHKKCDLIVPGCMRSEGLHKRSPQQSSEHPLESPQDGSFLSLEFNFLAH